MPRDPRWAGWTFAFGWIWWPTGEKDQSNQPRPGHVRIGALDVDRWWEIPIRVWDELAQKHMNDRTIKPGQPVQMNDRRVLTIPYMVLDDEADALMRRQMRPNADRSPVRLKTVEGVPLNETPRDFFESLAATHIQRRKTEPPISLRVGNDVVTIDYECFDAIVKDFVRNQRDRFLAAGKWPELLIHEGVADPRKPGPLPVQGRADAFGQGAVPGLTPVKPLPGQGGNQLSLPGVENESLT
jgi:hypothetical protein